MDSISHMWGTVTCKCGGNLMAVITDKQKEHVDEYHAFKAAELKVMVAQHETLTRSVPINTRLLENIIDVLEGPEDFDLHGESKGRDGGMVGKQSMIERDITGLKYDSNGGKGFSVRNKDKIIIGVIAALPAVAIFVASAIWGA